jgi:ankyrin repeat protein
MLIERGADVNARNWMGQTALFRAGTGTNTGMIELLAAHGADPNIRDKEGRTALTVASSLCQYWNIKALLAHGANPLIRNNRGRTALEPDYVASNDPKCSICSQLLKEAAFGRR